MVIVFVLLCKAVAFLVNRRDVVYNGMDMNVQR